MAIYNKKLKISGSNGIESCNIYSTTSEAGNNRMQVAFDNSTGYVALNNNFPTATKGKVSKNNTTMSMLSVNKPPYTEQSWTTAGTYTWTCPVGVTRVRVAVCGGGGGSLNALERDVTDGSSSTFGNLITATGGSKGYIKITGTACSGDLWNYYDGAGGSPNGRSSRWRSGKYIMGGAGFALSFSLQNGWYGQGGGYYHGVSSDSTYMHMTALGGSGGYNTGYVNVSQGSTYQIVVGNYGTCYDIKVSAGDYGYSHSGFVLIAYGGDI